MDLSIEHTRNFVQNLGENKCYNVDLAKTHYSEEYFSCSFEEMKKETCLTKKNQMTSIKILENAGLIEKKVMGSPASRHFRFVIKGVKHVR